MTTLTNLTQAIVDANTKELDGKTLTRPALLVSDGLAQTYCVDVDIGQKDPLRRVPIAHGNLEIVYADVGAAVRVRRSGSGRFEVVGFSKRMPGTYHSVGVTIPVFDFQPQVRYGLVVPRNVGGSIVVGTPTQLGWTSYVIPLGEFPDFGGFGMVPFGAIALYKDGVFSEITT